MHSTFASGPTCAGLPWKVGDLTQLYFGPSATLSFQSVYFGSVVSSQGPLLQSPSYQECLMLSWTFSLKNWSWKFLIGAYLAMSPPGM